jgi:hypothetical protein
MDTPAGACARRKHLPTIEGSSIEGRRHVMGKVLLFALFTSPAWVVMLASLVTSHQRGARLDLTTGIHEAVCFSCANHPDCASASRALRFFGCEQYVAA